MYTFPGYVTQPLIDLMASERQIVPYLDMPLQHADRRVLKPCTGQVGWILSVKHFSPIREKMPEPLFGRLSSSVTW